MRSTQNFREAKREMVGWLQDTLGLDVHNLVSSFQDGKNYIHLVNALTGGYIDKSKITVWFAWPFAHIISEQPCTKCPACTRCCSSRFGHPEDRLSWRFGRKWSRREDFAHVPSLFPQHGKPFFVLAMTHHLSKKSLRPPDLVTSTSLASAPPSLLNNTTLDAL